MRRQPPVVALLLALFGVAVIAVLLRDPPRSDGSLEPSVDPNGQQEMPREPSVKIESPREAVAPRPVETVSRRSEPEESVPPKGTQIYAVEKSPPLEIEDAYYKIEHWYLEANMRSLDQLDWATKSEHWNPLKKRPSDKALAELKESLSRWREELAPQNMEFTKKHHAVAVRELDKGIESGLYKPLEASSIDTTRRPGRELLISCRGKLNYFIEIVPRDHEELVHTWIATLRARMDLERNLRQFFIDLDE